MCIRDSRESLSKQIIYLASFFKHAGRSGTSRTTRCQNFSLERPLALPKTFKKQKKILNFFAISELSFSSFLIDFGGARLFLTSNSSSSRFFALDGQIFRSVRPLKLIFRHFTIRTSTCGGKARATEIPEGAKPPRPPLGQGTGNRDS